MNAREAALERDLAARVRLSTDPIFQIKQARRSGNNFPRYGVGPAMSVTPTPREIEILRYMSRGLTIEMTAEAMAISVNTVKELLKAARHRVGAKNTTHACCEAIRLGMMT